MRARDVEKVEYVGGAVKGDAEVILEIKNNRPTFTMSVLGRKRSVENRH